jgi:hypothetical protein
MIHLIILLMIMALAWPMASGASAQVPQGEGERSSGGLTPEEMLRRRSERLEEFLRKLDTNGDGMIDAEEASGGQKLLLERMIGAAAVEVKYPLSIRQLREALMKSYQSQVSAGGSDRAPEAPASGESRTGRSPRSGATPQASPATALKSGLDQPLQSSGGLTPEEMLRGRSERLQEFLRKMDTNGNGMIEAHEARGGEQLFLERMISAAGMEVRYPLSMRQVHEALMKTYQPLLPDGGSDRAGEVPPAASGESPTGRPLRPGVAGPQATASRATSPTSGLVRSSGGFTPEEMLRGRSERLEEFLRKLDTNANGMIDEGEVTGGQKLFLERMIRAAAVEVKYPLSISQVREALMKSYQSQNTQ